MTESRSVVAWGSVSEIGIKRSRKEILKRGTGQHLGAMDLCVTLIIVMVSKAVYICQTLSNGTLLIFYTSVKLLRKKK